MKKTALVLWIVVAVTAGNARAERLQLELIPLNHRTPQEVLPVVRPLVVEGGSITAANNRLIVKSTPANIAEIKQVLAAIDRAPRRLMITVRQDVDAGTSGGGRSLSGRYSAGDATVAGGGDGRDRDHGGLVIRGRDNDGNVIEYRDRQTHDTEDSRNSYRVQTLEGHAAFIRAGSEVPVTNRTTYIHGGNIVQQDTTDYYDATSGFYVLPRVNGDRVTLLISPRQTGVGRHGGFDVQDVETTVSGRLGEWIEVGGISRSSSHSNSGLLSGRQRQQQARRSVLLKVEEISQGPE